MTEEKMRQLKELNMEIRELGKKMYNMKGDIVYDTVKGSSSKKPYAEHIIRVCGTNYRNLDRKKEKVDREAKKKEKELQTLIREIDKYIKSLDDSNLEQVLWHKFFDGFTNKETAEHMGVSVSTVKRIYQEWKKSFAKRT